MTHKILRVEEGSIAQELGLAPGDELVSINGQPIIDFVDYQALCAEEELSLLVRRGQEETLYELEKDEWEPLGLEFGGNMLGKIRLCANRCRFCFVDQLPKDARPSMRVKDDDWRLYDLENLVCCSYDTHLAIHYGSDSLLPYTDFARRSPNDTIPWR